MQQIVWDLLSVIVTIISDEFRNEKFVTSETWVSNIAYMTFSINN